MTESHPVILSRQAKSLAAKRSVNMGGGDETLRSAQGD